MLLNKEAVTKTKKHINCSIILPVIGDYGIVEGVLAKTIDYYKKYLTKYNFELIIIINEEIWNTTPQIQILRFENEIKIINLEKSTNLLGVIYNLGLHVSNSNTITFIKPGLFLDMKILKEKSESLLKSKNGCIYTELYRNELLVTNMEYGCLQCEHILSIDGAIFNRIALLDINGFDESEFLQNFFEWDVFLRLSKYNNLIYTSEKIVKFNKFLWSDYPFSKYFSGKGKAEIHENLIQDLEYRWNTEINKSKFKKVLVVGGLWEPTHNQLCFYNYFETEMGKKEYIWKPMFDFLVNEEDILGYDLVIISRGKHNNCLNIIEWCKKHQITTLYMIDDNWLTVGEEWPEYQTIFSSGKPAYEVFLKCLNKSDAVIVYSAVLANYIEKYSKKLIVSEVNINLKDFGYMEMSQNKLIGYSGSNRNSKEAFLGLKKFLNENEDWKLLIFGMKVPEIFGSFDKSRIVHINYTSYPNYIKKITKLKPSILIAPLDDSETSKSKCPNKFLEITASGAVGIYSNTLPYSKYVKDKENGLLINTKNDSDEWYEKIQTLATNIDLRKSIFKNAFNFVEKYFDTQTRYSEFNEMVGNLINQSKNI